MIRNSLTRFSRLANRRHITNYGVVYDRHGDPETTLRLTELPPVGKPGPLEVIVKMICAPINPGDLNMVEGTYGIIKHTFPAIGGNEGLGVVSEVGYFVKNLRPGDWVLPSEPGLGTWRTEIRAPSTDFRLCPTPDIPEELAASLAVNPATAYRLLHDFQKLKPGDWVVQNCASSAVGIAVVCIAKMMGLHTINIVSDNKIHGFDIMSILASCGGDVVLQEGSAGSHSFKQSLKEINKPIMLALNGSSGSSTSTLCRMLSPGGTIVTYGAMSKKPVNVMAEDLVYKNISCRGFWMSRWNEQHDKDSQESKQMWQDLGDIARTHNLAYFVQKVDVDDFSYAIKEYYKPGRFRKILLQMDLENTLATCYPDDELNRQPWTVGLHSGHGGL